MPIKSLWTCLFIFCYTFVFFSQVKSQQQDAIAYHFDQDTITVNGNQTFSNKLNVTNQTDRPIELSPYAGETKALEGLIRLPASIVLKAKETRGFPLKYIADRRTITSDNQVFTIGFRSNDKTLLLPPARSFYTKLEGRQYLALQTDKKEYFWEQATNQVQFMLHVSNTGMVPLTFQVLFAGFPQGFEITGDTQVVTIPAGGQLLLSYAGTMLVKDNRTDFDLSMQAKGTDGRSLAMTMIRITQVGSVKRFGSMDSQNQPYQNTMAFRYINMGNAINVYQLQANGAMNFDQHRSLEYRLTADYYHNQKAFNSYDTYLSYQEKDWAVKVGNIYENLDRSLSGRGLKASYKFNGNQSISVYGVENNYMLYSQSTNHIPAGKIWGAKYNLKSTQHQEHYLLYLHGRDNDRRLGSEQWTGKTELSLGSNHSLGLEAGYSMEYRYGGTKKHAVSAGLDYNHNSEKYQLSSINYYSSPYYTGLRRGLIQTDSRMVRLLGDGQHIAARLSYLNNRPTYQEGGRNFYVNSQNQIQIYELGYHQQLGRFQLDVRPYWMLQRIADKGMDLWDLADVNGKTAALRTSLDLNFFSARHRFFLRTDHGYAYKNTLGRPLAPFYSLRMTGTYTNPLFGFNTFVQLNPYYLSDIRASGSSDSYRIFSLGPNTQFKAFNNSLQVQLSTMYSYYGFTRSSNFSVNGNMKWQLKSNWMMTADVFYTLIKNKLILDPLVDRQTGITSTSFDNRQIRLGIEKHFGRKGKNHGHKLQLFLFDDRNSNGLMEGNEPALEGLLVRIDKETAMTDRQGRVKFLDMATGSYMVQVENNQGWVAQGTVSLVLTKNQQLKIPLVKTAILRGRIRPVENKYLNAAPELSGICVQAKNEQGQIYKTLSNADGDYTLYLPVGTYELFIATAGMPFTIDNPSSQVEVRREKPVVRDFNVKDVRRKVDVKRF
ncbi:hypothetical protein HX021_21370 [Sphingobacterium sp. N143]|nr:hypothetical protein [Sphingobacterium sp. N143]